MSVKDYSVIALYKNSPQVCTKACKDGVKGIDLAMEYAGYLEEQGFDVIVQSVVRDTVYRNNRNSTNC